MSSTSSPMTVEMSSNTSTLTVSLESHLRDNLKSIASILPSDLHDKLSSELDCPEIHYSLLSEISQWARTDEGKERLTSASLKPGSYQMISLLAGTRTAPSSKPPPFTPSDPEEKSARELNNRKAITAIINGLLTVICSGCAAWWAADKSGWRDEWKVLFALGVAAVVGLSETILFIIWQSRNPSGGKIRRRKAMGLHKKLDDEGENAIDPDSTVAVEKDVLPVVAPLRRRTARRTENDERK